MLGTHEAIGGIVVALLREAGGFLDQLEAIFSWPIDRVLVERMCEVEQLLRRFGLRSCGVNRAHGKDT